MSAAGINLMNIYFFNTQFNKLIFVFFTELIYTLKHNFIKLLKYISSNIEFKMPIK